MNIYNLNTSDKNQAPSTVHPELITAIQVVYEPCGFGLSNLIHDEHNSNYEACCFQLNGLHIRYRLARVTPTKVGQFVAIWKRTSHGTTTPYDTSDPIDFIIIATKSHEALGQFIFPRSILIGKGIISSDVHGKRGIRVYPPWDKPLNRQARQTQMWQLDYFLNISNQQPIDITRAKYLLGMH